MYKIEFYFSHSFIFLDFILLPSAPTGNAPQANISTSQSNRLPSYPFSKQNHKIETSSLIKHTGQQHYNAIIANRQQDFIRKHSVELKANTHSENQQFLKEVVTNVLDGLGVGWLKISRVKKLMEDENYRNFALSRLNINLDRKYSDETDHIEDVVSS